MKTIEERIKDKFMEMNFHGFANHTVLPKIMAEVINDINRWIPFIEETPDNGQEVICKDKSGDYEIEEYHDSYKDEFIEAYESWRPIELK